MEVSFIGHDTPTFHVNDEVVFFKDYLKSKEYPESFLSQLHFLGRLDKKEIVAQLRCYELCVLPSVVSSVTVFCGTTNRL